ncbi:phage replisome organizer N-terminal domain-containing protein [Brevibacillus laterosporus]|uniref:phage replisome organizer N-terminal domain-containing protein n=1 Tax=Brevibacillus laterosporus TaxID=1465 RepID=UPI00144489BE|nr:phage replisome organizer N-terminal domain-containing protein [Brevibacillus laterosporus]NKQ20646.1 replication protein [Brevibacillus laterosporus]WNX29746.1 phage replisome organizer N-terminal domain-containing protein [Brevibacillus laterosporus]
MDEIKWIKITTTMFDDQKIDFLESLPEADAILVIWIKLLTLAGKCNAGGYILLTESIPYTDEMLSHKFKRPLNTVRLALQTFQNLDMINIDNSTIHITNWEKHQNVEGMEKIKAQTRQRVERYRQKQKLLGSGNATCNVTVTHGNATDIDKELDKDIDKELKDLKDIPSSNSSKRKEKPKKKYAEFVSMTEEEYEKLVSKHGKSLTEKMIEKLDNYKGAKGKKYKSDYRAILNWVEEKVLSEQPKGGKANDVGALSPDRAEQYRKAGLK